MATNSKYGSLRSRDSSRDHHDPYRSFSEHSLSNSITNSDLDSLDSFTQVSRHADSTSHALTTRECVELFYESVEAAKQGLHQSLAASGGAVEALRPKLTLDMSRKNLAQIPSEVVAIIKEDIERLVLSHNQLNFMSIDFGSCSALRYLNLRSNRFTDIPYSIFALRQLEILDIGKNELSFVPPAISNLKVLRVFSIRGNRITDLPSGIGSISTLRLLRLDENPWNPEIEDVIHAAGQSYTGMTTGQSGESERERHLTTVVMEYLRKQQTLLPDYTESPLETPRALSRFPVNPNDSGYTTNGSDGSGPRSPGYLKSRSHSRTTSTQHPLANGAPRRPGITPLSLNNDRNRSNSESVLQATQNKSKRMGIIPKKKPELEVLEESKAQRNSFHLRGQSHSSALKNMLRAGEHSPNGEADRHSGQKGTFMRRLSSVPEQKQSKQKGDNIVESAKSVLYSLHTMQPYLTSVVALSKHQNPRRSSLERCQHQASVQLEALDQAIHDLEHILSKKKNNKAQVTGRKNVCRAVHASIGIFSQIAGVLMQNLTHFVVNADRRYLRAFMVVLWGSATEERNARRKLIPPPPLAQLDTIRSISRASERSLRVDTITPTQGHPQPERRVRKGSFSQHTATYSNAAVSSRPTTSHSNAPSIASSRSSSRTGFYPTSATSFATTPRSGESFGAKLPRSRAGSIPVHPDRVRVAQNEQELFEKIYFLLSRAVEQGLASVKQLEPRFIHNLEQAERFAPADHRDLWISIIKRLRSCEDFSEALKQRLQSLKLNDPSTRNSLDFWRLVEHFSTSYVNLVDILKNNRTLVPEARSILRPVQKLTYEYMTLISQSPWEKASKGSLPPSQVHSRAPTPNHGNPSQHQMMPPPVPYPSMATHQHYQHRRPNGSNGSTNGSVSSPYNNVPATPMSAALGPAAQATIPKTPASTSGSMAGVFEGNFFQRADNWLSQGSTFKRPSAAP